jgi:hypothetical protein
MIDELTMVCGVVWCVLRFFFQLGRSLARAMTILLHFVSQDSQPQVVTSTSTLSFVDNRRAVSRPLLAAQPPIMTSSSSSSSSSAPRDDGRILYPTGDRSSFPGGVLQSADLTPEMLANNLRAGLFPEKGQRIRVRPTHLLLLSLSSPSDHFASSACLTCSPFLVSCSRTRSNRV